MPYNLRDRAKDWPPVNQLLDIDMGYRKVPDGILERSGGHIEKWDRGEGHISLLGKQKIALKLTKKIPQLACLLLFTYLFEMGVSLCCPG